jgi:aryl-alcohol dehydrogenase-like predicted oxidoreductase
MVKHGDDLWHCLHSDFLADQLMASLDQLGLQTLDVCLLHNPEYFFSDPLYRDDRDLTARREVFYKRLEKAFAYFESQIQSGRLRYYGVSSNTATAAPDDPEATSLSAMLRAATVAATAQGQSRHHFAVLQCPMNLFEAQAALAPNTGDNHLQTVLNHAQGEGIAVLVNRPLNAIPVKNGGVFRLAECPLEEDALPVEPQLEIVNGLEDEYRKTIAPVIPHSGQGMPPVEFFQWAKELTRIRPQIQGVEHWEQIEHHMIGPHVNQVVQAITRLVSGEAAQQWDAWRERYLPELVRLIRGLKREATERSRVKTAALAATIDPLLPPARRGDSLSRKALWVLASTPGVTTVLNGMRTVAYVDDAMGILGWDPLSAVQSVYIRVKEASRNN